MDPPPSFPARRPQRTADAVTLRVGKMARAVGVALEQVPGVVFGVDLGALLQSATSVRAEHLSHDDKVRVVGGEVLVERECLEAIARSTPDDDEAAMHACLYVFHELAHLPQGIGDYTRVVALREVGEDELLDLDLSADHFAALAWALTPGALALVATKDAQSQSLCGYPVTEQHTPASRLRKARRMVSLRAEVVLRRAGALGDKAGYVVASFRDGSAQLALSVRGAGATHLAHQATLCAEDVATLCAAADEASDPQAALAAVDDALARTLSLGALAA